MLTLLFSKASLLMMNKYYWSMLPPLLLILSIISISNLTMSSSLLITSHFSMTDSMTICMIALTLWISALMLTANSDIKKMLNHNMFYLLIISLSSILILCFSASNLLMFYITFEASLIPTLLIIMIWGYQPERISAGFYMMLYTITASLPLILMIIYLSTSNFTFSFYAIMDNFNYPSMNINTMFLMITAAFLVKLPIYFMHLWLPKAHVEAPIAGSMILAAILLKLGAYGMMRWSFIMFYSSISLLYNLLISISIIGAIITNILCLQQSDLKALIAYSSVGHMGLVVAGTLSKSKAGQLGSLLMLIAHGFISSCMFCLANTMYKMKQSRSILLMSSSLSFMPMISLMWLISICCNMAMPPSINLLSELLLMMSSMKYSPFLLFVFMISTMATTIYSLLLYLSVNCSKIHKLCNCPISMSSIYNTTLLSHMWPVLLCILSPYYFMTWC